MVIKPRYPKIIASYITTLRDSKKRSVSVVVTAEISLVSQNRGTVEKIISAVATTNGYITTETANNEIGKRKNISKCYNINEIE